MFAPVFAALASAAVFYVILPVMGAFVVRGRWRAFRRLVTSSASLPEPAGLPDVAGESGRVLLRGELEAIGGDDELWLRTDSVTVAVSMRGAALYLLSQESDARGSIRYRIERQRWRAVTSIQPGLKAYATGRVCRSGARLTMDSSRDDALVILYDGSTADVAEAALRAGRHANEYWNPVGQASLAIGVLAMAGLSSVSLSSAAPALLSAVTLTAAFLPILPVVPPGLAGFMAYRAYWKKALEYRERRDVAEYRTKGSSTAKAWQMKARMAMMASAGAFLAALLVNAWLLVAFLRRIL